MLARAHMAYARRAIQAGTKATSRWRCQGFSESSRLRRRSTRMGDSKLSSSSSSLPTICKAKVEIGVPYFFFGKNPLLQSLLPPPPSWQSEKSESGLLICCDSLTFFYQHLFRRLLCWKKQKSRIWRTSQIVQTGIVQLWGLSYWMKQTGMTVPQAWQAPQNTQLVPGIWPQWIVWKGGWNGGVNSGGEGTGKGGMPCTCGRGWEDVGLTPIWELLGVKIVDSPVETLSLVQLSPSFSSFRACTIISSCFSSILILALPAFSLGEADTSWSFKKSAFLPISCWLRSLDRGNPRLTVSISWKASILLILLPLPPLLLGFCLGVWVEAFWAVASQLAFSSVTLQSAASPSSPLMTALTSLLFSFGMANLPL